MARKNKLFTYDPKLKRKRTAAEQREWERQSDARIRADRQKRREQSKRRDSAKSLEAQLRKQYSGLAAAYDAYAQQTAEFRRQKRNLERTKQRLDKISSFARINQNNLHYQMRYGDVDKNGVFHPAPFMDVAQRKTIVEKGQTIQLRPDVQEESAWRAWGARREDFTEVTKESVLERARREYERKVQQKFNQFKGLNDEAKRAMLPKYLESFENFIEWATENPTKYFNMTDISSIFDTQDPERQSFFRHWMSEHRGEYDTLLDPDESDEAKQEFIDRLVFEGMSDEEIEQANERERQKRIEREERRRDLSKKRPSFGKKKIG